MWKKTEFMIKIHEKLTLSITKLKKGKYTDTNLHKS